MRSSPRRCPATLLSFVSYCIDRILDSNCKLGSVQFLVRIAKYVFLEHIVAEVWKIVENINKSVAMRLEHLIRRADSKLHGSVKEAEDFLPGFDDWEDRIRKCILVIVSNANKEVFLVENVIGFAKHLLINT